MTNIPKEEEYRAAFVAQDPDYRIISADFSGQELRLLAHISQDPKFIYALKEGMDLHTYSASLIFNIPYEDFFEKNKDGTKKRDKHGNPIIIEEMKRKYRDPCKSITFGIFYGMGPKRLAATINVSIGEAIQLMNRYFKVFPKIQETMNNLVNEARKNKLALSPLDGRRRDLSTFDWDNPREAAHAVSIAKNLPFQGAGASVTKLALCKLKRAIDNKGYDARIINSIHDEILIEVHKDEAEEVAHLVKEKMISAFNHYAPSVPMEVNPDIANHWVH